MKNKIRLFLDTVFSFILFFAIALTLIKGRVDTALLYPTVIACTLIAQTLYLGASEKNGRESKGVTDMINTFVFTPQKPYDCVWRALKDFEPKSENGYIVVNGKSVAVSVSHSPLSYGALCDLYKSKPTRTLVVFCSLASRESKILAKRLPDPVRIFQRDKLYKLLYAYDALPSPTFHFVKTKSLRHFFASRDLRLSTRYVISSAIIMLLSALSPFSVYYRFFAMLCLCVALLPPLIGAIVKR